MNVVFMGTPEFAIPTLRALSASRHRVLTVITQPDKPKGRGMKETAPPVKVEACALGLPVFQPEDLSGPFVEELRSRRPEVGVVVAYGRILRPDVLSVPEHGCINLHPSLLPRYRGTSPIQAAILNGDEVTGLTTYFLDEGVDSGDIILQRELSISENDTAGSLQERLAVAGAELMMATLEGIEGGTLSAKPQDHSKATHTSKLTKKDGLINWQAAARDIHNRVRAMHPWPGAFTYYGSSVFKIWKTEVLPHPEQDTDPGCVLEVGHEGLLVSTGRGALLVKEVQVPGRRRMSTRDYLLGQRMEVGVRFSDQTET